VSGEIKIITAGAVCTAIIANPEKRNALTLQMLEQLHEKLDEQLSKAQPPRVLILKGDGERSFCSGLDLDQLATVKLEQREEKVASTLRPAIDSLLNSPMVTVAMINGHCFGAGAELAISCDLRYCADFVKIGAPPVKYGIVYPEQGLRRYVEQIGSAATRELFLIGRPIDSGHAREIGFVSRVLPAGELEQYVDGVAQEIVNNDERALAGTKELIADIVAVGLD
jgi:enoyl-CoA hydratase